ncbi:MAG: hypothetical protein J3R72DRAFT_464217 [Linnemannia gamsii]|nr:MAG: hypothetical protein J3R72DRAFT_464217 [Linnemannia gamsii]
MKVTFSSIAVLALAVASVTSAAPAKPSRPFPGKGKGNALSRESVATLKRFGWLPANYTAPAGGFGAPFVSSEPTSITIIGPVQGPSKTHSNARISGGYTCPGAKMHLEWWAKARKRVNNSQEFVDKNTEHRFNFVVTEANPEYRDFLRPQRSQGPAPDFLETRMSGDGKYGVTHDANWYDGRLRLVTNGQAVNWDLYPGSYQYDEDYSYIYIGNYVDACVNWFW